jgi:hypothetical protein
MIKAKTKWEGMKQELADGKMHKLTTLCLGNMKGRDNFGELTMWQNHIKMDNTEI